MSPILSFIKELAEYEHLFGERPAAEVTIGTVDGSTAGYALFFHSFSTFLGRPGIYLEDLYVRPAFRDRGMGRAFLIHRSKLAKERGGGLAGLFLWNFLAGRNPLTTMVGRRPPRAARARTTGWPRSGGYHKRVVGHEAYPKSCRQVGTISSSASRLHSEHSV